MHAMRQIERCIESKIPERTPVRRQRSLDDALRRAL